MNWSCSGFKRYDMTVRSPVRMNVSAGIPGTILSLLFFCRSVFLRLMTRLAATVVFVVVTFLVVTLTAHRKLALPGLALPFCRCKWTTAATFFFGIVRVMVVALAAPSRDGAVSSQFVVCRRLPDL
jgi:hypothetical protein